MIVERNGEDGENGFEVGGRKNIIFKWWQVSAFFLQVLYYNSSVCVMYRLNVPSDRYFKG